MSAPPPPCFPSVIEWTSPIASTPTYFCIDAFSDHVVIIISQLPSFGTIVHARVDAPDAVGAPSTTPVVRTLLGERDDARAELLARRLLEGSRARGDERALVVCVGLVAASAAGCDDTTATVRALVEAVDEQRARAV